MATACRPGVKKSAAETVLLMRCAAGRSSAGTARPINIRVAKTSCTRAVDGSGLSIRMGSCAAGVPHRLDKVDWVWLPRGHRQRQLQSWLAPRRGGEELARLWPRRPRLRLHCG